MNVSARTRTQLAKEYGIDPKTLRKWFCEKQITARKGVIPPIKVKEIYEKLGDPNSEYVD